MIALNSAAKNNARNTSKTDFNTSLMRGVNVPTYNTLPIMENYG